MEGRRTVVLAYAKAFAAIGLATLVGWLAGLAARCVWSSRPPGLSTVFQLLSTVVIVAATLGYLVDVASWSKDTPPERLSRALLWVSYVLGAFLFAVSVAW